MKKYLANLFLSALLALSLCPIFAFGEESAVDLEDKTVILDKIDINLSCGAAPDRGTKLTFDGAEIPAGLIMDTSNSYFYMRPDRAQSGKHFYTDGICNSGTIYGVQIALFVIDGYEISPAAKFFLNSQPIDNVTTVNPDGTTRYIFSREFSRTNGITTMITAGLIHDLAQPIAGKTPRQQWGSLAGEGDLKFQVTTKIDDTTGANVAEVAQMYFKKLDASGNEESMSPDEPFATDGHYRIKLLLSVQHWVGGTHYDMGSTFTITVNGTDITGPASTSGGFAFDYDFEPVTTLDDAEATVAAPAVGATPSYAVNVPEGAHYTASVSWSYARNYQPVKPDTAFENDYYTARVTFYANDGYTFKNSFDMLDSVMINGEKAIRVAHDPNRKWITFERNFLCGSTAGWMTDNVPLVAYKPTTGVAISINEKNEITVKIGSNNYPAIEYVAPTTGAGAKTQIDWYNTYYAYWNPTNKNWVMMQNGDTFKEGVLYKIQASVQAKEGYRLSPEATGSFTNDRTLRDESYAIKADAKFVSLGENDIRSEWLFLSMVFDPNSECTTFSGTHRYTDRYHSEKNPSSVCLNCGYHFGDVNNNGVVNIVDAQLAYDMIPEGNPLSGRTDYVNLRNRADVSGVTEGTTDLRRGDMILDAVDAFAIQYAAIHGWNN